MRQDVIFASLQFILNYEVGQRAKRALMLDFEDWKKFVIGFSRSYVQQEKMRVRVGSTFLNQRRPQYKRHHVFHKKDASDMEIQFEKHLY